MTPQERREPKILNGSRRVRIAKGSGRTVTEVNNLVDRFDSAAKMMKQKTGLPGLPISPPSRQVAPKKKSRSGNPAKRAQEESR